MQKKKKDCLDCFKLASDFGVFLRVKLKADCSNTVLLFGVFTVFKQLPCNEPVLQY